MNAAARTASLPAQEHKLFQAMALGDIDIANRVIMAPMPRQMIGEGLSDAGMASQVRHYLERSSAGMIITEGMCILPRGDRHIAAPGLDDDAQVKGWRQLTQAVHDAGTKIVAQLMQMAPPSVTPMSLTDVVEAFRLAAARAMQAGFDGVEIHGADGHLIDVVLRHDANLCGSQNQSHDEMVEHRCRFPLDVIDAVIAEAGAGRTGIRLSPVTPLGGASQVDPQAVFGHLIEELNKRGIAFAHFIEGSVCGARDLPGFSYAWARKYFRGAYIANNGYTREMAIDAVEQDHADAVSFGRAFLANADLVERLKTGASLRGGVAQAELAMSLPAM